MAVKRSRSPLSISEDTTAPDLSTKFKLLLVGFEMSMKSVFRADEALNKLYAFSSLFLRAQKDKRWWFIVDAEITAVACKTAREATQQAAEAAAAYLVENIDPPGLENRRLKSYITNCGRSGWWYSESPALENRQKKSITSCGRSGWWIYQWTAADELWATGFFSKQELDAEADAKGRQFQARAVEEGNVLQWCSVQVSERLTPCFEFEVAEELLEGDDVILRIGVANNRSIQVRVFLTEDDVRVVCSQEGIGTETSLGLGYLLPYLVRDYIKAALQRYEAEAEAEAEQSDNNNNVVQGLLRHVVGYLAFLLRVCVVCGRERLLDVPLTSTCGNICRARRQGYEDVASKLNISEEAGKTVIRREEYMRMLYSNTYEGRAALSILAQKKVVEKEEEKPPKDGFKLAAVMAEKGLLSTEVWDMIVYEEAVRRVAGMPSTVIAKALGIKRSRLWEKDVHGAPS